MKVSYSFMGELKGLIDSLANEHNARIEDLQCSLEILAQELKISFTIREMSDKEILERDGE